jgi:hypothetical protein
VHPGIFQLVLWLVRRYETMGSMVARQETGARNITVHLVRNGNGCSSLWDEMRFAGFDFEMMYAA